MVEPVGGPPLCLGCYPAWSRPSADPAIEALALEAAELARREGPAAVAKAVREVVAAIRVPWGRPRRAPDREAERRHLLAAQAAALRGEP